MVNPKEPKMKKMLLSLFLLTPLLVSAQSYSIGWYKIAGGGGLSSGTNGATVYAVHGTIGQPDAGGAMAGGGYSLTGGFWSLMAVVQTPGAPLLSIAASGTNAIISWPYPSTGYYLEVTTNLNTPAIGWIIPNYPIISNSSCNTVSVTRTGPTALFFRLKQ
jgi:hypothetical protein